MPGRDAAAKQNGSAHAPRRVSMRDVAARAGVSSQTVSRVSNGTGQVVEPTRERVLRAMRELGYRPNGAARALKRGEFRTLGVLVYSLSSTGNTRTLEAIASSAAAEGYAITLIPVTPTQATVAGAFDRLGELAVDAVIAIMEIALLDAAHAVLPPGIRMVVVDAGGSQLHPVVDTDQAQGARLAVDHLLDLGHETVWHVSGPAESFAAATRTAAWRQRLLERGQTPPEVIVGDWSTDSGYDAGRRIAADPRCTAVFAANDQMALGLLRALHERGVPVPGSVSVVGFDDGPDACNYYPPLTTVHQDFAEVGRRAVRLALARIHGEDAPSTTVRIPTALVVRESTGPAPATPRVEPGRS